MPDLSQLLQINQLLSEVRNNQAAMDALDAGERIEQMSIGTISISTAGWPYPPQMTAAIKASLQARQEVVYSDLRELGFTGPFEQPQPPPPDPDEPEPEAARRTA